MSKFAKYTNHYKDHSEGHIFLEKDGACTITLTGAASMTQDELDYYGELFTKALNEEFDDDYCNSILAGEMDSGDVEMLQEQLRKFSPPQEYDDE